ncbi:hypothetical protein PVAP13_3NG179905 [Panicum virgatum]|uniref:Uncharacterized protein n=1 Tax=Panicum virgatum TaxID=38727 RepID=A0A8T0UAD2_PANVG|nr:hypothetical protein PVAP13_3NG179905 [Panicum virgatum]
MLAALPQAIPAAAFQQIILWDRTNLRAVLPPPSLPGLLLLPYMDYVPAAPRPAPADLAAPTHPLVLWGLVAGLDLRSLPRLAPPPPSAPICSPHLAPGAATAHCRLLVGSFDHDYWSACWVDCL